MVLSETTDDVASRHVLGPPVGAHVRQVEVAFLGFDPEAVPAHVCNIGMEQEVDLQAGALEARAVEAAEGAGSDDGIASGRHGTDSRPRLGFRQAFREGADGDVVAPVPGARRVAEDGDYYIRAM